MCDEYVDCDIYCDCIFPILECCLHWKAITDTFKFKFTCAMICPLPPPAHGCYLWFSTAKMCNFIGFYAPEIGPVYLLFIQ